MRPSPTWRWRARRLGAAAWTRRRGARARVGRAHMAGTQEILTRPWLLTREADVLERAGLVDEAVSSCATRSSSGSSRERRRRYGWRSSVWPPSKPVSAAASAVGRTALIAFANGLRQKLDWGESNVLALSGRLNVCEPARSHDDAPPRGPVGKFTRSSRSGRGRLSPAFISFARLALGALVLVPVAAHSGALRGLRPRARGRAFLGAVAVGPFLLITIGERWISSSLAGILVASAPIFIVFLALWGDSDERSAGRQLVGVGTGMAGVALLLESTSARAPELIGALFVLLASFRVRSRRARAQAPPRRGAACRDGPPPVPCPPGPPTCCCRRS